MWTPPRDPSPELLAAIEARIALEIRPVAPLRPVRLTVMLTGIAVVVGVMGLGAMLAMMRGSTLVVRDLVVLLPALLLAGGAFFASLRLAIPAAAPPRGALVALSLAAPALLFLAGALVGPLHFDSAELAAGGTGCLWSSLALSVAPLVAGLVLARAALRVAPWVAGAALGAASAILGAFGTHLLCRASECGHLLLLHGGAMLVAAALGGLLWALLARHARRS